MVKFAIQKVSFFRKFRRLRFCSDFAPLNSGIKNPQKRVENVVLEKSCENKSCWKLNFTWNTCLTCHFWTKIGDLAGVVIFDPPCEW